MSGARRSALGAATWIVLLAGDPAAAADGRVIGWNGGSPPASVDGREGTVTAIAAGADHGCAIQASTGAVVCWGGNSTPPPAVDGSGGTATAIATGAFHSCAIQAGTGAVVCWGDNYEGGATPPPSVDGSTGSASAITTGAFHSCAIQAGTGAVKCWGYNHYGVPTPPPSVDGTFGSASAIASGSESIFSCAIRAGSGAVVCWGYNEYGEATPPASVNGTTGTASAIATGGYHACAIRAPSGAVVCWGLDTFGMATPPPSVNGTLGTASAIAVGQLHSCAIQAGTGAVICWGDDRAGEATPPPSLDGTAGKAIAIAASRFTLAIQARECSDGLDGDGDGLVDYPADPGCASATDVSEADCDDGADNDGDGRSDFPDDLGCDSPSDHSETSARFVCDDGLDNDGDGDVDHPDDRNCTSADDPSETVACDDGRDNDGDGKLDHPADPSCTSFNDDSEHATPVFELVKDNLAGAALLVGGDGNLYGSTANLNTSATLFRIDGAGSFRTMIAFPPEFSWIGGPTLGPDGAFYGTSGAGNDFFKVDRYGHYTALGSVPSLAFGSVPSVSNLVLGGDGALYGVLRINCDFCGTYYWLIKLTSTGSFSTVTDVDASPWIPSVVGSDGALYGWKHQVFPGVGSGASLFRLPAGGAFSILKPFTVGILGNLALGGDGLIYGPMDQADFGGLFRIDGAGNFTPLHEFEGTDGSFPSAPMTPGSDGAMYGATSFGGSAGAGTVYRVDPAGAFSSLHSFNFADDGGHPQARLLRADDGVLYGTGAAGPVLFRVDSGGEVTSFFVIPNDLIPDGPLFQGSDCALYGVAKRPADWPLDTLVYRVYEPGQRCPKPDADGDGTPDPSDNCPAANPDQSDTDTDGVGDACDNCVTAYNPRVASNYLTSNPWATLTGGQRDDDHDGYGNRCDGKFPGVSGASVGPSDLGQFRASNGKMRALDVCGTSGAQPCAIYDLSESDPTIGPADLGVFRSLNGKLLGPKCASCPLLCSAGPAGSCP